MLRWARREKGRAVWALAAVALLVVPLVFLFLLWSRAPTTREVEGWRFVPRLTAAEFRARPTMRQPCQTDAQCDAPLVCAYDPYEQRRMCMASSCDSDAGCAPYGVCRSLPIRRGPRLATRVCVLEGTREEGAPCLRSPRSNQREWGCGQGLVCAGVGWCGRRCVPGQEGTCPEGFFCARGDPDGPVCQPSCEGRACSEGQQCIQREGGVSVCARVRGRPCPGEPCPGNQVCETEMSVHAVDMARRRCVQPCGQDGSGECPERSRCHQGRCRPRCRVEEPDSCGPFRFCVSTDDAGNGVCLSSPEQWDMGTEPARDDG